MELTLERPGEHLFIRSVSDAGIKVVDTIYSRPIIISAQRLIEDWPVTEVADLAGSTLEPILSLEPEIVLLGTGARQVFLPPREAMVFYGRNVGLEVMTTAAACRTFNVLMSEGRNAVAALLPAAWD